MDRKQHTLVQGTPEWHQFRATHFGASEASAMLGISPYKSRTELLREKKTGIAPEVDAVTQRIFDRGHEIEALARPLAETFIGDDLYPVTCSLGNLSASCDGLTMDESTAWECKSYNKADFETVSNGELPEKHWPQCQQVLHVTGAEKLLFTISDGEENTAHVWVYPDVELQQRIVDGWEQFKRDLETFEPEPEVIPAKADPVMSLPSLLINVGGSISIQSNLDLFGHKLKEFIEETNAKPETDQDFANLEQACKTLKDAEEALKRAEANALAQTASVDEMRRTVAYLADLARTNRLTFEKLVKSEKENRKTAIVTNARLAFEEHQRSLQKELSVVFLCNNPNFADAIKNKKNLSAMQDAVNTMLANAKIEADAVARELREKHTWYMENGAEYSFLFSDLGNIIYKATDDFRAVVASRIAAHKEQEQIKAEQAAKAQAEREEQIRREAEEKARREEQERIRNEQAKAEEKARREEQERIRNEQAKAEEKPLDTSRGNQPVVQAIDTANDSGNAPKPVEQVINEQGDSSVHSASVTQTAKTITREAVIALVSSYFEIDEESAEEILIYEFSNQLEQAA